MATIYSSTRTLDRLISFQQVYTLRRSLRHEAKSVQSLLRAEDCEGIVHRKTLEDEAERLRAAAALCSRCHHPATLAGTVTALQAQTERYRQAVSRLAYGGARERRVVLELGDGLVAALGGMVSSSSQQLEERTLQFVVRIKRANGVLMGLVAAAPLLVVAMAAFFVRRTINTRYGVAWTHANLVGVVANHRIFSSTGDTGAYVHNYQYVHNHLTDTATFLTTGTRP